MGPFVPPPEHGAPPLTEQPPSPASGGRSKLIGAGAAVAVLAGLAFLLFGSAGAQLSGPVAQAATVSSSTPGYRMHMAIEMASSALATPVTASGDGIVDLRDHATSMSLVMNLGGEPQAIQQLGSATIRIDMITDGAVVYAKLPPAVTSALPTSGREWIKLDLARLSSLPGLSSLAGNPTTSDPSHVLQTLRSVSDSVVNEGQQRVDGVQTTHFQAELSLAQLAGSLPPAERTAADRALSALQQALPAGNVPVDVWIDGHHLVRRVLMSLHLGLPSGPSIQESVTLDLSDYGPQQPPIPPSPDKVMDLSTLAGTVG